VMQEGETTLKKGKSSNYRRASWGGKAEGEISKKVKKLVGGGGRVG